MVKGIQDCRVRPIVPVDMSMDQIARLPPLHKGLKARKAPVRLGVEIMDAAHGRMGHQQVHAAVPAQGKAEAANPPGHLLLGILMRPSR